MLTEGATKDEVAGVIGVSVSTLYRRLGSGVSRVGKRAQVGPATPYAAPASAGGQVAGPSAWSSVS